MKISRIISVLLLCPVFLQGQDYEIANWLDDKSSATVLTFDDWSPGHGPIVVPQLISKKLPGTFFVVANSVWKPQDYTIMSNAMTHGIEIANHSKTHPDLTTLDSAGLETEVNGNKTVLESHVPKLNIITFAYPFGAENEMVRKKVMEKHIASRGVSQPSLWKYSLNETHNKYFDLGTVVMSSSVTGKAFTNHVKKGIKDGGLVTFLFHSVYSSSVNDNWAYPVKDSLLIECLDSLKTYEDQTWVTTVRDAILYHSEKKSAQLSFISETDTLWRLSFTDALPDSIYNHALTIKLKIPQGKVAALVMQGNDTLASYIKGKPIMFNAVPDGGEISIVLVEDNSVAIMSSIQQENVFPNPTTGQFNLKINSDKDFQATVKIYDSNGKELLSFVDVVQKGENIFPVAEKLSAGNYFVSISGEGAAKSYKVVVK
ncbi:MAG: polysaccharide deacetylase family protein [Flavobacteriales bacterium]